MRVIMIRNDLEEVQNLVCKEAKSYYDPENFLPRNPVTISFLVANITGEHTNIISYLV